jgi:protein-S-isoprenylcysteine O-methyltransferase Ste14
MRRVLIVIRAVCAITVVWLVLAWMARWLHKADVRIATELPPWIQFPGEIVLVVGAVIVLGCGAALSMCGIGTLSGKEWMLPKVFIASGPFRFVRNPMSLGAVILALGLALNARSGLSLALAAVLFAILHWVIVRVEEPGLDKRFGDSYRDYKQHVPRWIPRIRPWRGNFRQ